jgi:hypothetical protein
MPFLAAGLAHAQTPSVSSDISVTLVEIPVEVTKGDEPVRGLSAADFEVREGKNVLPIVSFEVIDLEAPPKPEAPPPPPAARRHVLFLFDFANSPGESGEPDLVVGRLSAGSLPPGSYLLELRLGDQDPSQPRARAVTARPFRVAAR